MEITTYYCSYEDGNNANSGLSFAQRRKTLDSVTALMSPGDDLRVMGSPAPTSLGINTTWTHASKTVTLASALTQMIADCETNWTASANVTCTSNSSDFKENTKSQQIAIAAAFTTGLAAYFATGTLDLSGYKQVTFWIKQTAGTVAIAGDVSLRLCSDTAGVTTVNNIAIPALVANNQWVPVTVDTGSALGSSIKSVALYVDTDRGAQTFLIDCVNAAKDSTSADSLSLTSLIGLPDSTGAGGSDFETWYGIQSINGTTVKLDNGVNTLGSAGRGWAGWCRAITSVSAATPVVVTSTAHGLVTGDTIELRGNYSTAATPALTAANGTWTVTKIDADTFSLQTSVGDVVGGATGGFWPTSIIRTGYKRETIKTTMVAAAGTDVQTIAASGSAGSVLTISGGWNRTDMSTQTLETWFDGQNGLGIGVDFLNTSYVTMSKIACTRYGNGFIFGASAANDGLTTPGGNNCTTSGVGAAAATAATLTISATALNNNANNGIGTAPTNSTITVTAANSNTSAGLSLANNSNGTVTIGTCSNNGTTGALAQGTNARATIVGLVGNGTSGGGPSSNQVSLSVTISANNGTFGLSGSVNLSVVTINTYGNATAAIQDTTGKMTLLNSYMAESTKVSGFTAFGDGKVFSQNDQGVLNSCHIYCDGGDIATDTSVRHTASGVSWKMSPTSANRSSSYPLTLSLAKVAVNASALVTITAYFRRTNTAITGQLVCRGGQIAGVPNNVTASMTALADTWEQLSISFTPTVAGVVEIEGWAYGGTTNSIYVDDMGLSQA